MFSASTAVDLSHGPLENGSMINVTPTDRMVKLADESRWQGYTT